MKKRYAKDAFIQGTKAAERCIKGAEEYASGKGLTSVNIGGGIRYTGELGIAAESVDFLSVSDAC